MIIDDVLEYMELREGRLKRLREDWEDNNYVSSCGNNLLRRIRKNLREGKFIILSDMEMLYVGEMIKEREEKMIEL